MNDIQIFSNNEFGDIRTIIIEGEPYFVGNDCAKALGYKNLYSGVSKNVDEEDRRLFPVGSTSGTQGTTIINESGLYSLIFGSKLESAKKFKKWVTSEVLPSIRKTGEYKQESTGDVQGQIKLLAQGTTELYNRVENVESEVNTVKWEIESLRDELPLFPSEADEIKNAVNKRVVEILGGKQSNAYKDKSLSKKVFINCYQTLKGNFEGIGKYTEIKRKYRHEAVMIVEKYQPPLFLAERIANENAQRTLNLERSVWYE